MANFSFFTMLSKSMKVAKSVPLQQTRISPASKDSSRNDSNVVQIIKRLNPKKWYWKVTLTSWNKIRFWKGRNRWILFSATRTWKNSAAFPGDNKELQVHVGRTSQAKHSNQTLHFSEPAGCYTQEISLLPCRIRFEVVWAQASW